MSAPSYTLCICPDSYLLKVRIQTLLAAHPPSSGTWEKHVFWGDEAIPASFWEHLTLQGLFATSKAIILRNAQNIPAEQLKNISQAIMATATTVWPILCFEAPFDKGKPKLPAHIQKLPCYEYAQGKKLLDIIQGLDQQSLPFFIREESQRLGMQLTKSQENQLTQLLPADALHARSELEKLALLTQADGILPENSFAILEQSGEITIFELLQSLQNNRTPLTVWQHIQSDALGGEKSIFGFLAILLREARALWQISMGETPALPPFVISNKKIIAKQLGMAGIAKLWELVMLAEKGIKSGEVSPEQAFDSLAAQLFILFSPQYNK